MVVRIEESGKLKALDSFCGNTNLNIEFVASYLQSQDIERIEEQKTTIMVI